jgi:hypothetical protein
MDPRLVLPAECFVVSASWLDVKGELMPLLQSKEATRGLLGQLTVAHQGLSRFVSTPKNNNQKLTEARAEAESFDERHDGIYKGIYYCLVCVTELYPEKKDEYTTLREYLFPDGLAGVTRSYAAEAGEVGLLEARLEASHRAALQVIVINGVTLLSWVEELIQVGKQLGAVEAQKKVLAQELELDPELSLSEINEGKARWFAVANLFSGVVRYAGFTDAERVKLLAPFEALEKAYQERAKERSRKKLIPTPSIIINTPPEPHPRPLSTADDGEGGPHSG